MNRTYQIHKFLEWSFYLASLAMTFITAAILIACYHFGKPEEFFSMSCQIYWITVIFYMASRQISKRYFPMNTESRRGEFFVVGWVFVAMVYIVVTAFFVPEKMELMKELILNLFVLGSVFGTNEILKAVIHMYLDGAGHGKKKA